MAFDLTLLFLLGLLLDLLGLLLHGARLSVVRYERVLRGLGVQGRDYGSALRIRHRLSLPS